MAADYGTSAGVAALVPRYASGSGDSADFTASTRPTENQIDTWLEQVGDILNSALESEGFTTPISDTEAKNICTMFVEQEVAAIAEGVNGSGRFGPAGSSQRGTPKGRFSLIMDDVQGFIAANAKGLKRLGAIRSESVLGEIKTRETDDSGDTPQPLFQREGFGETYKNWDR